MYAACIIATLALLIILVAASVCSNGGGVEGFSRSHHNRTWPTTEYYWHRAQWADDWPQSRRHEQFAGRRSRMWWWRYPGYAAPLELSLPLYNFYGYLYGYPPAARMPYNP